MLGSGGNRTLYLLQCCSPARLRVEREIQGQSVTSHPDPLLDASYHDTQLLPTFTPACGRQRNFSQSLKQGDRGLTPWQKRPTLTHEASPALSVAVTWKVPPWPSRHCPAPCRASRSFRCQSALSHWQWHVPLLQETAQHQLSSQQSLQLHKTPEELSIFTNTDLWTQGSRKSPKPNVLRRFSWQPLKYYVKWKEKNTT